jgi:LysM repeat protein
MLSTTQLRAEEYVTEAYTIQKGDTLGDICKRYNVKWKLFKKYNTHIPDLNKIDVGDVVYIPLPKPAEAPKAQEPELVPPPMPAPPAEPEPAPPEATKPAPAEPAPIKAQKQVEPVIEEQAPQSSEAEEPAPAIEQEQSLENIIDQGASAVEEIKASSVGDETGEIESTDLGGIEVLSDETSEDAATLSASEEEADAKPYSIAVSLSHAVASGTFIDTSSYTTLDEEFTSQYDYIGQSYALVPSYRFEAFGRKLSASAILAMDYELTTPNSNPARRFNPADVQLKLSDGSLYKDEWSGVNVSASLRAYLPTSYGAWSIFQRYMALRGGLGLSKSVGDLSLSYGFSYRKNFNASETRKKVTEVSRVNDPGFALRNGNDPFLIDSGYSNTSFTLYNSFSLGYSVLETLSLSYAFSFINSFKYHLVDVVDEYTSPYADAGRGRSDLLSYSLGVSYALSSGLKDVIELPFSLSLAAGVAATHGAQTADNQSFIWPTFYHAFGENRAANNYGSFYLEVSGSY